MEEIPTLTPADDEARWQAVQARAAPPDGAFFYGVQTTGVFCRPSCGARTPLRKNVRFHETAQDALASGFRPCLRCKPLSDGQDNPNLLRVQHLCRYIQAHAGEPLTLETLATEAHLSPHHLQKVFQSVVGISPREYAEACRLQRLRGSLRKSQSVTAAIFDAGYGSSSRIYEKIDTRLGMTPQQYRSGGKDMEINYAVSHSPLGLMLIGATDRGLCFVQFGGDEAALYQQLQKEYPQAHLAPMPPTLAESFRVWMACLGEYLSGAACPIEKLPLDISGTAFQYKVWRYLQSIPAGQVQSYTEVAQGIGQPTAVRAVASACAANRVAMVIPCHRVIRGNGELGGYRWGLDRKRTLLAIEAGVKNPPIVA